MKGRGSVFDDGSPIYRQIAARVRDEVLRGVLAPDDQVMSTTQYASHYRINPATAAKAFQQLVDEGVLYKRRGVGMFVCAEAPERLRAEHRDRFLEQDLIPLVGRARALGLTLDDLVDLVREAASRLEPADDHER